MLFKRNKKTEAQRKLTVFLKAALGIKPKHLRVYETAFTHSSILAKSKEFPESNERLEFLGDAILDSIIATQLYKNYPSFTEGELTKQKAKIVSRKTLNQVALELGLEDHLVHSVNSDARDTSLLGNALEALIGAVYLDQGHLKSQQVVLRIFHDELVGNIINEQKDHKSLLHEWGQQHRKEIKFKTIDQFYEEGRSKYTVEVSIDGKVEGRGVAFSKKRAQKLAAAEAYQEIFENSN